MQYRFFYLVALIVVCSMIALSTQSATGQTYHNMNVKKAQTQYGTSVELVIDEQLIFPDSLTIGLTSFSHKRPHIGGPTKATAYLWLALDDVRHEFTLSVHGVEGKSQQDDGLTDDERYSVFTWLAYEIHLQGFTYDESIKIMVTKKK